MLRYACIGLGAVVAIPLILLAGLVALSGTLYFVFVVLLDFGAAPRLEYMFDEDDPAAVVTIRFHIDEVTERLDESGHLHGVHSFGLRRPSGGYDVMLDSRCARAWFRTEGESALRIIGLESSNGCAENREQLVEMFKSGFVLRLEGRLPPLAYHEPQDREFRTYEPDDAPVLILDGTMLDARRRLDTGIGFQHQFHDGVYYLSICGGRFRLRELPAQSGVEVIGIGYVHPCNLATSDACLEAWFRIGLGEWRPTDDAPDPSPTQAGDACPDPFEDLVAAAKTADARDER
jgi:hypothetical protein